MAKARLSMRKIKEVLRLKYHGALSRRQIAQICQVSRSTVADYLYRAEKAGMSWPLPEGLTDAELEQKLFPPHPEQYPDGYQYSQFCKLYRRFQKKLDYCMRQDHRGGEKLFVDYGEGLSLLDPKSGAPISTQLFVAVWGASNYTYAEETLTQQLPDWIGSHVRAFSAVCPRSSCRIVLRRRHSSVSLRAATKSHLCRDGRALRNLCAAGPSRSPPETAQEGRC
jgi:hypothetical protein